MYYDIMLHKPYGIYVVLQCILKYYKYMYTQLHCCKIYRIQNLSILQDFTLNFGFTGRTRIGAFRTCPVGHAAWALVAPSSISWWAWWFVPMVSWWAWKRTWACWARRVPPGQERTGWGQRKTDKMAATFAFFFGELGWWCFWNKLWRLFFCSIQWVYDFSVIFLN